MADRLKVIVFLGSTREGRTVERVAALVKKELAAHDVETFDPMEMPFEVLRKPLHFHRDPSEAPEWLRAANEKIKAADAFVIISPEYNATIPPALTNMLDHFPPTSYSFRPCVLATYSPGGFGGCRSAAALRPFVAELSMTCVPSSLTIPKVMESVDAEGNTKNEHVTKNAQKLAAMVEWYGRAMKNHRTTAGVPS